MGAKLSRTPKTVAVCGATGQQGGATIHALLKLGVFTIKAITRDTTSKRSQALAARDGVRVVKADFDDLDSLKAAFEGCDAVFAVTDFWVACGMDPAKEIQQGKNLVDAAVATSVKHFVFSSLENTRPSLGDLVEPVISDYTLPHFDTKGGEIEKYMFEKFPKNSIAIVTSIFYENMLPGGGMAPAKQDDGTFSIFVGCPSDTTFAWCSTEDIGGVAAAVIKAGPSKWGGKTTSVTGEHATVPEIASTLTKITGVTVKGTSAPPDIWAETVTKFGVPVLMAKILTNAWIYNQKVGMLSLRPLAETKKVYSGVQSFETWVQKNKETFVNGLK
jgi:uncharacterized protein YbjT (DUF2867 family)